MAKPAFPEWASSPPAGNAPIDAGAVKRQMGWNPGEKPPNQWMNWLHYQAYLSCLFFDAKTQNIEPIVLRSAATASWDGAQLTFTQQIQIVFRNGDSPTRINQIAAGGSPIALADGQVVVVYRDRINASPVTLTLQGVYANLAAGQYAIVAESSLTSTKQENEMILFRRNGTDLEVPMLGIAYPTGSTIAFGRPRSGPIDASDVISGTFANARIAEGNVTQHQAALALAASQITSGTFADARIAQSNVTQHQAALSILESQIADGAIFSRLAANETITGTWAFNTNLPTSTVNPTAADQLTRKGYVDSQIKQNVVIGTYTGNGNPTQTINLSSSITPAIIVLKSGAGSGSDPVVNDIVFWYSSGTQYSSWNSSMQEGGVVIFNQPYANAGICINSVAQGSMTVEGNGNQNGQAYYYIVVGY